MFLSVEDNFDKPAYSIPEYSHQRKIAANKQETESWMRKFLHPDRSNPPFHLAIIEKHTNHVIGMAGVYTLHPQAELGYMLHPDKWGVGYATEALTAFLQKWWELPRHRQEEVSDIEGMLFADAHKENIVSLRLMEKLGFEKYKEFVEDGDDIIGLRLRRPQF